MRFCVEHRLASGIQDRLIDIDYGFVSSDKPLCKYACFRAIYQVCLQQSSIGLTIPRLSTIWELIKCSHDVKHLQH